MHKELTDTHCDTIVSPLKRGIQMITKEKRVKCYTELVEGLLTLGAVKIVYIPK